MKKLAGGIILLLCSLMFSILAFSQDKVVVVPLIKCDDGLTNCSGKCVDTKNNPNFCGSCAKDCGTGNYCSNGICKKEAGQSCTEDTECLTGKCSGNICIDVKLVFVSSIKYSGNLGGLSGADSKCQSLAQNAGLPGVYKAWLSDSNQSPSTRFTQSPLDYVLVGGPVIANGWADLTDSILDNTISNDEYGVEKIGHTWTNTNANGTAASGLPANSCSDWWSNSAAQTTTTGISSHTDSKWTYNVTTLDCFANSSSVGHLYCFEQ